MKAITIYQPWASLLACGAKLYETRSWATKYRGEIAIHAGLKKYDTTELGEEMVTAANKAFKGCGVKRIPFGYIVATAELVGCWEIDEIQEFGSAPFETGYWGDHLDWHDVSEQEILFGNWTPGRFAWEFKNILMLPDPISAKGMQGLWNWDREEL